MKTLNFKSLIVAIGMMLLTSQTFSQDLVCTRIDVAGSRFTDQMWLFAVPSCTRAFDNGWDGYKMFGTSTLIPQIFVAEATANFQIDAIPDLNNTYISFKAGEDSIYRLTFTHQLIETVYSKMYLVDSVANTTVDVTASGSQYIFNVLPTAAPVRRFKILTTNIVPVVDTPPVVSAPVDTVVPPVVIVPPVVTDPVVIVPPVVTDPVVIVPPVVTDPIVTPPTNNNGKKDKNDKCDNGKKDKPKKIKIHCEKNVIVIENSGKCRGKMKVFYSVTGKQLKNCDFNSNGITRIITNFKKGAYVVNAVANDEEVTTSVMIQ